jgi:uncharacterized membrane protein YkvA (DUF1232 family)
MANLSRGLRDLLLTVPKFLLLILRLLADPRVSTADKAMLAAAAAYTLSPFDLIPDFLPWIGHLDDLFLLALAIDRLIGRAGPQLVLEHWDGSEDALEVLCGSLDDLARRLPVEVRRRLTATVEDR